MSSTTWRQGWTALVLSTLSRIALGALALLLAASVLPALVGWQSSVVMSGSMEPTFSPGDVAVVRPVATAALEPGSVVLVDDPDLPGQLRLHRLVAVESGGLQLKGDANPRADGSLVDPADVHGAVALRLPLVGEPAVWFAERRVWPLVGTAVALAALLALAVAHRRPDDAPPAGPPAERTDDGKRPGWGGVRRSPARVLRRGTVLTAAVVLTVSLPGATAGFSDTASTPRLTVPIAAAWNCTDVAGGANAAQYFRLQETRGNVASNTGAARTAGNGTYAGNVASTASGPPCGAGDDRAIVFDGRSARIYSTQAVPGPQTFSLQLWFQTTTGGGGKLIGFGNGTNGDLSSSYDRHVYMTDSGQLVFGVYNGSISTVTSPRAYNDGAWHLVTATFSAGDGLRLYVDGAQVARGSATGAEPFTGFWRIGFDNLNTWPSAPTSRYFAGSLAHVSIYGTVLSAAQVRDAWQITR
ncbi:LamG-like jellyroll fold domain-containing protein [Modestobacter sp. SYSU DS0511]